MPHNLQLETVLSPPESISGVPFWHRDGGSVCPEVQRVFKKNGSKEELQHSLSSKMFVSIVTMFTVLVAPSDVSVDDSKEKF